MRRMDVGIRSGDVFFFVFFFFGRQQRLQVEEGAGEVFLKAEAEWMLAAVVGGWGAVRFWAVGVCCHMRVEAGFKECLWNWIGFGSLRESFFTVFILVLRYLIITDVKYFLLNVLELLRLVFLFSSKAPKGPVHLRCPHLWEVDRFLFLSIRWLAGVHRYSPPQWLMGGSVSPTVAVLSSFQAARICTCETWKAQIKTYLK